MDARGLLAVCEGVYDAATIVAGRDGRDGASVLDFADCCVLAFRGTLTEGIASHSDWYNDFHADLVTDPRFPGRVHAGFLESLNNLLPQIDDRLDITSDKQIYITGHSKGGALAFLAAHLFADTHPYCVTFAAPRVGDYHFSTDYMPLTLRFENPKDIVPRLPPIRYYSCGSQIVAPASFCPPEGIRENHSLETGYRPWVM